MPDFILKIDALSLLDNIYPEFERIPVFKDDSRISNATGAFVYCKLFAQYSPVGQYVLNFDAQVYADFLSVPNLKARIQSFNKTVVLVDSGSAIETIALKYPSEAPIVSKIKNNIRNLNTNEKTVGFQWIKSHVDIDGNEKAYQLEREIQSYLLKGVPWILLGEL